MKSMILVMFGMIFFIQLSAQNSDSDIRLGKGGRIFQGSNVLKPKDVLQLMEPNPEAHAAFKKAKANYDGANVLGAIGGALIGWPLGTALGGGDPQWGLAAGGVAVILLALPLNSAFKKNANVAIDLYNHNKPSTAQRFKPKMDIALRPTGMGIIMRF